MFVKVDGVTYTKEHVMSLSFDEFKTLISFVDSERDINILAHWHSEEAEDYALQLISNI